MDTDWCLNCNRRTNEGNSAYCSNTCMNMDRTSLAQSLPAYPYRRASFDLPATSPPRRGPYSRSQQSQQWRNEPRARPVDALPREYSLSKARFLDNELQDSRTDAFVATHYAGKGHAGIIVWAQSVFPGLEEECSSPILEATTSHAAHLEQLIASRPPIFPLTTQNLAPPCVTIAPRHVLLNHTSTHCPSNLEDHTAPSLSQSQDDASLLTPASESVITPSVPERASPSSSRPIFDRLISKVCSWIATPPRVTRAMPAGNPISESDDYLGEHSGETHQCYLSTFVVDKSSAGVELSRTFATRTGHRNPTFSSGYLSDSDAA